MTKKKLLLITAIPPFPKDSGGAVRINNTIQNLSKKFELHLIYFKNKDYLLSVNDQQFLKKYCNSALSYDINPSNQKFSFIKKFQPFWYSQFYNQKLIKDLPNIISKNKIKIVQIEFTQLLYLIKFLPKHIFSIFTAHDISTISTYRRMLTLPKLTTKIRYLFRWLEILIYEQLLLKKFNLVCSVSEHDQKILQSKFNLKNVVNTPNGIENLNFLPNHLDKKNINLGYLGSFSHPPNELAFKYFINEIAPKLEKQKINYIFYLAGNNDSIKVNQLINDSPLKNKSVIVNLGFVNTPKDFYQHIDILIAPIQSGSGTRIKILESLSFGIPVISSLIGAEGLNFHTPYLQITNSHLKYVKLIQKVYTFISSNNLKKYQLLLKKQLESYLWSDIFLKYTQLINKYVR